MFVSAVISPGAGERRGPQDSPGSLSVSTSQPAFGKMAEECNFGCDISPEQQHPLRGLQESVARPGYIVLALYCSTDIRSGRLPASSGGMPLSVTGLLILGHPRKLLGFILQRTLPPPRVVRPARLSLVHPCLRFPVPVSVREQRPAVSFHSTPGYSRA